MSMLRLTSSNLVSDLTLVLPFLIPIVAFGASAAMAVVFVKVFEWHERKTKK